MKRWLSILLVVAVIAAHGVLLGQGPVPRPTMPQPPIDLGPGDQGATLKQPWMDAPPVKAGPPSGSNLQKLWNPAATPAPPSRIDPSNPFGAKVALPPSNPTDINRDIELQQDAGSWVIFLISYSGEKAPHLARKCVMELRNNPSYRLNAFVFNYGAEEKRKEFERVQKLKDEQKRKLIESGVQQGDIVMPVRVRVMRIDEQTGVLVAGGFKTREQAQEALKAIRTLPPPDPRKLDMAVISDFDESGTPASPNQKVTKQAYVSPFVNAFVAHNPCLPKDVQTAEQQKIDMDLLNKLNDGEPLSLLKCKHGFTLVVKQFNTQVMVQDRPKQASGFTNNLFKKQESVDYAAKNAASLAELLRRGGCNETYVLHTKYSSFVTVGGYDNLKDPRMGAMQTSLVSFFNTLTSGTDSRLAQVITQLDLPTQFQPMWIPR